MAILLNKSTIQEMVEHSRYSTIRVNPNPDEWWKEEESENDYSISCFELQEYETDGRTAPPIKLGHSPSLAAE